VPPQVVITSTITPGIDGGPKQSKSLNNYIALTDTPRNKFGKLMSLPDSLVGTYARVYTELPLDTVAALGDAAIQGGPPARDAKLRLASAVVTRYHGAGAARTELEAFTATFSKRENPPDIPEVTINAPSATLLDLLQAARPDNSRSELRRLISQGAVLVGGTKKTDPEERVDIADGTILRSGRRTWHRISSTNQGKSGWREGDASPH
jgi:tyrosyl-tRNA synthetase